MRAFRVLLPVFWVLLAVPAAARQRTTPDEATRPGQVRASRWAALVQNYDEKRYAELTKAVQAADVLYRNRQHAEAQAAYAKIRAGFADAKPLLPYVIWMDGVCQFELRQYDAARACWDEVLKSDPEGEEAYWSLYYTGLSYRQEGKEDEAFRQVCRRLLDQAARCPSPELLARVQKWLKNYYEPRVKEHPEFEADWLACLDAVVRHEPTGNDFATLFKYYLAKRDAANCRKVAAYRYPGAQGDVYALGQLMAAVADAYALLKDKPEEAAALRGQQAGLVQEVKARLADLEAHDAAAHRDLYFQFAKFCCLLDLAPEAGALLTSWMKAHPNDREALMTYGGYVRPATIADASFDAAYLGYLKAHPTDADMRDVYARQVRQWGEKKERALAALKEYGAGPWQLAYYWRGLDDLEAAKFFAEVAADAKAPLDRRQLAAWQAASALYAAKRYAEALPLYELSNRGADAGYYAGDCHLNLGAKDQALATWLKARDLRGDRELRCKCGYEAAKLLLAAGHKDGPAAVEWLARQKNDNWKEKVRELCKQYKITLTEK